ncbi:MAG: SH3 domain-containing protein [Clostridia bacterium]|nr:SH3 domain-containing protein [Clostridia bacterium]
MKKRLIFLLTCILLAAFLFPTTAFARDELKNTDPDKYYIVLDTKNQFITVYERDDMGEYTRIVRRMICTTGRKEADPLDPESVASPTPNGTWKIGARERFGKFASFQGEYARYWTQIVDGVYFHSIMFGKRDIGTLKSGAFSHLGQDGSHGCVRLYIEDAKWLYYHACPGTNVKVTGSEPSQKETAKALKTEMSFKEYDAFQKNIYDTEPLPDRTAWVVMDRAPLRTGNGSNDKIIRKLDEGTKLTVLQEGDPWIKATDGEKEGYIKRAYVTYEEGVPQSRPDGRILGSTVYLYAEANKKSTRLCKVPHDTSIVVLEEDDGSGFTKIQYFTSVGYVETRAIREGWATVYEEVLP